MIFFEPPRDAFAARDEVATHATLYSEYSNTAAASIFAQMHAGVVRWCWDAGRWAAWDGVRWVMPADHIVAAAVKHFLGIYRVLAETDERLGRGAATMGRAVCSMGFVNSTIAALQSERALWAAAVEFDRDAWLLNCPNGVLDLRTGELRPHDSALLMTQCAGVAYDPVAGAQGSLFERWLREVFVGDEDLVRFVRATLGYCLTGDTAIHALFFWHGDGRNGKSTLGELAARCAGSYALKVAASLLAASPSERHPAELAQLRGVRMAFSSEVDRGVFWNEARLKELTGDTEISARFMRENFFTFPRTHKHLIYGNNKPRMRAVDDALAARLKLVEFRASFKGREDTSLPERLAAEAPIVLRWLAAGAAEVWAAGRAFPEARAADEAVREYMIEGDVFAQWLSENCVMKENIRTRSNLLYADYNEWKRMRGETPESVVMWSRMMKKRFRYAVVNGKPVYYGVGLQFEGEHETVPPVH